MIPSQSKLAGETNEKDLSLPSEVVLAGSKSTENDLLDAISCGDEKTINDRSHPDETATPLEPCLRIQPCQSNESLHPVDAYIIDLTAEAVEGSSMLASEGGSSLVDLNEGSIVPKEKVLINSANKSVEPILFGSEAAWNESGSPSRRKEDIRKSDYCVDSNNLNPQSPTVERPSLLEFTEHNISGCLNMESNSILTAVEAAKDVLSAACTNGDPLKLQLATLQSSEALSGTGTKHIRSAEL